MDHRVPLYVSRATCPVFTSTSTSREQVVGIRNKKFSSEAQFQTNPFTNQKKKEEKRSQQQQKQEK